VSRAGGRSGQAGGSRGSVGRVVRGCLTSAVASSSDSWRGGERRGPYARPRRDRAASPSFNRLFFKPFGSARRVGMDQNIASGALGEVDLALNRHPEQRKKVGASDDFVSRMDRVGGHSSRECEGAPGARCRFLLRCPGARCSLPGSHRLALGKSPVGSDTPRRFAGDRRPLLPPAWIHMPDARAGGPIFVKGARRCVVGCGSAVMCRAPFVHPSGE
jgi:hypothetical protein